MGIVYAQLPLFPTERRCTGCKKVLPLDRFHLRKSYLHGRDSLCKPCRKEYTRRYAERDRRNKRAYEEAHAEEIREWRRTYRETNRERITAYNEAYRQAHPEVYRGTSKRWSKRHPATVAAGRMRRYARIKGTRVEPVSYESILDRDGMVCHLCGRDIAPGDLHFDHVIPLSRGGPHTLDNIKPTHAKCNLRKHNRLPEEMAEWEW